MKSSTEYKIVNQRQAAILMSETLLQSVRHLVDRCPVEAQWFHTVRRLEDKGTVYFVLENLLLPKQYVSGAAVETPPEFQLEYWNELVARFGDGAGDIVRTSGAWCHSHVKMQARPSGTDEATFKQHCEDAAKQNNDTPQLMLIFNKQDDYYSRVWDPTTGLVWEGRQLITVSDTDYTDLNKEMDAKFLTRPTVTTPRTWEKELEESFKRWGGDGHPTGTTTAPSKQGSSPPVELNRSDYMTFHDTLDRFKKDGLAEDIQILRDMVEKYLSDHYVWALYRMAFASVDDIRRLAPKAFASAKQYRSAAKRGPELFWAELSKREFDATRVATALDRCVDLAATTTYQEAAETLNGFLADADLVVVRDNKSPHTRTSVSEWEPYGE